MAISELKVGEFVIRYDSNRFKLSFDKDGALIMRCPRTGNIYVGIADPEGILIQYPCGTKHFIKHE